VSATKLTVAKREPSVLDHSSALHDSGDRERPPCVEWLE
jgi:hypothetical protein